MKGRIPSLRWPFVLRSKYDRQIAWGKIWHDKWAAAQEENRELRAALAVAYRKMSRKDQKRGTGGKFVKAASQ